MTRLILFALACGVLQAQNSESLADWQFYKEIAPGAATGLAATTLDADALAGARDDAADLRIYDAAGVEIPYALRVLRSSQTSQQYQAAEFNRSTVDDAAQITLDLGENPGEHNEIEVKTAGENFRRHVSVEGSDDGEQWASLVEQAMIFRFTANGTGADIDRVRYPPSRFRYLRITVHADQQADATPPEIESAAVRLATVIRGREQAIPLGPPVREAVQANDRPASQYRIDLPGRMPVQALRFTAPNETFARPFVLASIEGDNIMPATIASGRLARQEENQPTEMTLRFQEVFTPRLRLTIVDDRNPPLELSQPIAIAAVRQVIVDLDAVTEPPLRLYYGNPHATAPNYDFEATLPAELDEDAPELSLGVQEANSDYQAPEPPLTERAPWLIYVVLAAASVALLGILRNLVFDVDGQAS